MMNVPLSLRTCLLVLLSALSMAAASCSAGGEREVPVARNGVIDLTGWDFEKNGPAVLAGEWEFYWDRLLWKGDFDRGAAGTPDYITLPCEWNNRTLRGEALPGRGFATHRLTVKTGAGGRVIAFRIMDMATAYRLYVDDILVAGNGVVGISEGESRPQLLPLVAEIEFPGDTVDLILQVSNFHHRLGGPWFPILMGTEEQIRELQEKSMNLDLFISGALIIMCLYHLGLFLLRRKDKVPLYFGIFALLMAVRILVQGEHYLMHLLPWFPFELEVKINYLTFFLAVPAFNAFFYLMFPGRSSKAVLRGVSVCIGVLSIIVIAVPARIFTHTLIAGEVIAVIVGAYILYVLVRAALERSEGALIFILAWLVFFAAVLQDMLYGHFLYGIRLITPLVFLAFIFAQAFILSKRFTGALNEVETLNEELGEKNRDMVRFNMLRDQFLAGASHELRTPLNGIIGIAESLMDGATGSLSRTTVQNLSMIAASGRSLSSLISDMLDFARLRSREIVLNLKPVDIVTLVDIAIELTRPIVGGKSILVVNNVDRNIPEITVDEDRLQQIIINLLRNAIKFTSRGRITVSASVRDSGGDRALELSVSDTGIGIPGERLPDIFKPFEQVDGSDSRQYGGIGIGLSIAKELIELHRGTITVESVPGEGSVFTITLPYGAVAGTGAAADAGSAPGKPRYDRGRPSFAGGGGAEAPGAAPQRHEYRASSGRHTVLVVDDDPLNLKVLENHLSMDGYTVIQASNGEAALAVIEAGIVPDLILLDIMMPRMSGYEVSRRLREKYSLSELPIIMVTAKSHADDIVAGFEAGANDYLTKPIEKRELLARASTHIALREAVIEKRKLAAINEEMEIARKIQESIIPGRAPRIPGLDIAVKYIPMDRVGGDFYNYHILDDRRIGVLMSDVTGHGVPASMIASMVNIIFTMLKGLAESPPALLSSLGGIFMERVEQQYLTAGYLFIDTGERKGRYARCGHEPLLLYRRGEHRLYEFKPKGLIIGFLRSHEIGLSEFEIRSGDRIVLYTDCVTELFNQQGRMFGEDRFREMIMERSDLTATAFIDHLVDALGGWSGRPGAFDDDFTVMVIDVL
jgi:two-component system, sensor histidine kinase ChiS